MDIGEVVVVDVKMCEVLQTREAAGWQHKKLILGKIKEGEVGEWCEEIGRQGVDVVVI